jgi:hypothetical protein
MWTAEREKAAQLNAADQLSDSAIAAEVGIQKITIERWKRIPEFRFRVHEHLAEARKAMLKHTLVETDNQIALLTSRLAALRGIIRSRGERDLEAPGYSVVQRGLQTKTLKNLKVMVPSGKSKRLSLDHPGGEQVRD